MVLETLTKFVNDMGIVNLDFRSAIMICVSLFFLWLAIKKGFEPLLLVPIAFGMLLSNMPLGGIFQHLTLTDSDMMAEAGIFTIFYALKPVLPSLIFLGVGAMTDFGPLIANPKSLLMGAAAQFGIFTALFLAVLMGFDAQEAASIGIIGGADGPTAIYTTQRLAPHLLGAIAVAAYSYMALVPVIQPPIMKLLTTEKERTIKMKPPRAVSKTERIMFPIIGLLLTCLLVPSGLPLLGMLFFGNLLKESTVTKRLADTARGPLIDIVTILIGLTVGASTQATTFLTAKSIGIFVLGAISFVIATCGGVLFVKFFNLFLKEGNKINPLIGNAGVSAVPDSARVSEVVGLEFDKSNHLLMHAMGCNVAGVIGSAVAAGILLSFLS